LVERDFINDETSLANAALIAAAPDLLAALEALAAFSAQEMGIPLEECVSGPIGVARAAIAKARGES
jgi:hypothetical protein